jgi:hypothetical protein
MHHQKKKHFPSGIFHSCPRFYKQQAQAKGPKLQKKIENMEKKPLAKMQQYQWSISIL